MIATKRRFATHSIVWAATASLLAGGSSTSAAPSAPPTPPAPSVVGTSSAASVAVRRSAIIVGANAAAAQRRPLRFAHRDAQQVAAVLQRVGGFRRQDTHVLLDPTPSELLATLDRELTRLGGTVGPSMLVFYYSGHADERAFFPNGQALSFEALRGRLDDRSVAIRIGIIDTCRGGGWTGTRGLVDDEPFDVEMPLDLSSEGSVLIASSSGLENAHESEALKGGFFTHHWNAALSGAGDRNGDGAVTLSEAYDYAKRFTIRDTALRTETPQHPSFQMNLRGRRDVPLARLSTHDTRLDVHQRRGPIQLIHLGTGLIVLELPEGERSVRLAVSPGRYVLRAQEKALARAIEVDVVANKTTSIREADLELVGRDEIETRGGTPRSASLSAVPRGDFDFRTIIGTGYGASNFADDGTAFALNLIYGISDRWSIDLLGPAVAYRGGTYGDLEWVPALGVSGFSGGYSSVDGAFFGGTLFARTDLRWWLSRSGALQVGLGVEAPFLVGERRSNEPDNWDARFNLGFNYTIGHVVTLSVGVGYEQNFLLDGRFDTGRSNTGPDPGVSQISFGSVLQSGLRQTPLIKVHLTDSWSLDAYVAATYSFRVDGWRERYAGGFTWVF